MKKSYATPECEVNLYRAADVVLRSNWADESANEYGADWFWNGEDWQ